MLFQNTNWLIKLICYLYRIQKSHESQAIDIDIIIFHFLWNHLAHYGIFENGVLLMYTLEGVSTVANFITAYEESQ